ncbi:unnamed protein product [Triticum turgidum subsp. durum]|uniref:Phytocyanin domain-containing protein n=1 Tax=Triticum turgidum subsp. durum TaxID=4567 RepID=A0A9R0ZK13_TRITD|nr:unnamed protein product [Triticum turgidum subsp. durum]
MGSLLLLSLLVISGVGVGGGVRLAGNGGYEDWRLGTATYIKESQGHPLNDGMYVLLCSYLSFFSLAASRTSGRKERECLVFLSLPFHPLSFLVHFH